MSDRLESLRLGWHVVVRNWMVYRKDFLANISPTLADPALVISSPVILAEARIQGRLIDRVANPGHLSSSFPRRRESRVA